MRTAKTLAAGATVLVSLLLYFQALEAVESAALRIGIAVEIDAGSLVVTQTVPGLPAERDGLESGDLILSLNGMALTSLTDYDRAASGFQAGEVVEVGVLRAGERLTVEVRPGVPVAWGPWLVNALAVLGHLALALLALSHRRADLRARLLFWFPMLVAIELSLPSQGIGSPLVSVISAASLLLVTGLQMGMEIHLAILIPDRPKWLERKPWIVPALYVGTLVLGVVATVTYLVEEGLGQDLFPWSNGQLEILLFDLGVPIWAVALLLLLGRPALAHPHPEQRHQAGFVLLGVLPWTAYVLAGTLATLVGATLPPWTGTVLPLLLLCYPVAVFTAIFRYHLVDIELVVRRSFVYTALTSTLLLVFYATLGVGGALASRFFEDQNGSIWVVSGATLLLGLLFSPLRRALQEIIDRRFFPERRALRERLGRLAAELPAQGAMPRMGHHLVRRVCDIFGVRAASLLVADPKSGLLVSVASTLGEIGDGGRLSLLVSPSEPGLAGLDRPILIEDLRRRSVELASRFALLSTSLAVPLASGHRLVGLLLLGAKSPDRPFPSEEVELLTLLSHHVATVFENARLFESATYDSLTGLLRREAFEDLLGREILRAIRYERPLTLAMADLDHFKSVNDRFGHLTGDAILRRMAEIVASGLRTTDAIGRYGGEEFIIVLPETSIDGAEVVAEKIRRLVASTDLPTDDGPIRLTISIGLAPLSPSADGIENAAENLVTHADRALYRAKHAGRNRVERNQRH